VTGTPFDRAGAGPDPPWRTIGELAGDAANLFADTEFLRFPDGLGPATREAFGINCGHGTSLTFHEVNAYSNRLARVLAGHGVRPGDRVAIMMDNVAGWPLSWLAVLKADAIAVPVNARYQVSDLAFVLADSGAVLVLTDPQRAGLVRAAARTGALREVRTLPELAGELAAAAGPATAGPATAVPAATREPPGIANFQYTSGTTGFPKACMLSHEYWLRTAWLTAVAAELRAGDVMLMAQAFSYMDPQWATVMCLMGGCPLVVLPRFSASGFWNAVRAQGATLTYVLGAMPVLLFKQPPGPLDTAHRMRLVLCSGIVPELHRQFEERWGAPWRELYGSTESGLDLAVPPGAGQTVGTGAMGRPPPGKQVRIADETGRALPDGDIGEIVIRGKPMMHGYWNHPEDTERAFRGGWYHSGDLGYRDGEGWIYHAGRLKDIIRRGGENISAAEVENVLALHPAVSAVALVGIPDELFGELPKAFVQLKPGHEASTQTAVSLLDHVRGKLARFKVPAYLEFVAGFPMTPSARIRKRELLEPGRDQRTGVFDAAANSWV
jgi:acyl-CoA synthetase (AMP-forming)/AMP-acid ligase II